MLGGLVPPVSPPQLWHHGRGSERGPLFSASPCLTAARGPLRFLPPKFSKELLCSAPVSSSSSNTGALLRGWGGKGSTTAPPGGLSSTKPYRGGHLRIPQRPLYPGLQTLSPVLPPGSAGIPNHSLSGFPFLAPAQAGKSWPRAPGGSKTPSHAPLLTFHPLLGRVWGW